MGRANETLLPETIRATELAGLLGITPDRLAQLAAAGHVTKAQRGQYRLAESIRLYTSHLRSPAARAGRIADDRDRLAGGRVLLVVEDDEAIGKGLETALVGQGYDVRWCRDGTAGLAAARVPRLSAASSVASEMLAIPARLSVPAP